MKTLFEKSKEYIKGPKNKSGKQILTFKKTILTVIDMTQKSTNQKPTYKLIMYEYKKIIMLIEKENKSPLKQAFST